MALQDSRPQQLFDGASPSTIMNRESRKYTNSMDNSYSAMEDHHDEAEHSLVPEIVVHSSSSSSINFSSMTDDFSPSEESQGGIKTIRLLSWNTFSIPFANPRFLCNTLWCCRWLETVLSEMGIVRGHNDNELVLCCFQELWAFKIGVFPQFVFHALKYAECVPILGYLVVVISVFLSTLHALIISLIVNITRCYNPKQIVIGYFQQYFGHSVQFPFIPWFQLMDNGLLILSNHAPNCSGYRSYSSYHGEDGLVAKGFIWCYFEDLSLLVINTHLQASGSIEVRVDQLSEIKTFIKEKRAEYRDLKVLLCGDFNIDMTSFAESGSDELSIDTEDTSLLQVRGTNIFDIGEYLALDKVSSFQPTFPAERWNIDHVFADLQIESKTCRLFDSDSSDHRAVYMKMNII